MTAAVNDCPFCAIAADDRHGQILHRAEHAFVIEPLGPVTPGHRLVIPYTHVADATADPHLAGQVVELAARYAAQTGEQCNIITSVGPLATQTVFHLHVHVVPRREHDALALPWTGPKPH